MKLWATVAAAGILAGSAIANDSNTNTMMSGGKWQINVALGLPTGDHSDAGFDTMYFVGADWMFGGMSGYSNVSQYFGFLYGFGEGDSNLESTTYGVHYGVAFGFGQESMSEWTARVQGGFYNTKLDDGTFSDDEWGFGGKAGIFYNPKGSKWNIGAGYYWYPKVSDGDNTGWFFMFGLPIGN